MQKFLNNYETTLIGAISDSAASFYVAPAAFDEIESLALGDYYFMTISDGTNQEIVKVTGVTIGPPHMLVVERDASAVGHGSYAFAAGSSIKQNVTREALHDIVDSIASAPSGSYPPSFTTLTYTWNGSATTNSITFNPLAVNYLIFNSTIPADYVINVLPGTTFGTAYLIIQRASEDSPWPLFAFNGDQGSYNLTPPPRSGLIAVVAVTKLFRPSGSAVSFTYFNGEVIPFSSRVEDLGTLPNGTTININAAISYLSSVYKVQCGTGCSINFQWTTSDVRLRETFVCVQGGTGVPTIKHNTVTVTPKGTAPGLGVNGILKATMMTNSFAKFEWL